MPKWIKWTFCSLNFLAVSLPSRWHLTRLWRCFYGGCMYHCQLISTQETGTKSVTLQCLTPLLPVSELQRQTGVTYQKEWKHQVVNMNSLAPLFQCKWKVFPKARTREFVPLETASFHSGQRFIFTADKAPSIATTLAVLHSWLMFRSGWFKTFV